MKDKKIVAEKEYDELEDKNQFIQEHIKYENELWEGDHKASEWLKQLWGFTERKPL